MTRSTVLLLVAAAYGVLLAAIAARAMQRLHNAADFFLGSRRVAVWLTALGCTANAPNAWILLSAGTAAFTWGLSAVWLWPAILMGYAFNWFYVAPRLHELSASQGSMTLIGVFGAEAGERMRNLVIRSAVFIAAVALFLQVGAQLLMFGTAVAETGLEVHAALWVGATVLLIVVLIGGYWAVSLVDAAQVVVLTVTVLLLSLFALLAVEGWDQMRSGFAALGSQANSWMGDRSGVVALAFVLGVLGIGLAMPGQPHIVLRFIAARSRATLDAARWISLACMALLLAATLLCGWCARVLYDGTPDAGQSLLAFAGGLLPPAVAVFVLVVIAGSLLSGIASPLLVAASAAAIDLKGGSAAPSLTWSRVALVLCALAAAAAVLLIPAGLFERVLFAWSAMGAAFGPLLLVRLSGKRVRPGSTLGAMWAGFMLTFLFHVLPDAPGDFLERILPFVAALGIALSGGERRRNPDRADRSQDTVHDRVPI